MLPPLIKRIFYALERRNFFNFLSDKTFLQLMFYVNMDKKLDLKNPKTFNEKLQLLKLYNRDSKHTTMVDKYQVREYISEKFGEEYLIPLLGVWDDPAKIDFEALPQKFVLKCNHNSGLGMCICIDKEKLDIQKVKNELARGLKQNYYLSGREWPYKNVPRRIICEQFMTDTGSEKSDKEITSNGLTDYKFFVSTGKLIV